jgi:ankyrin repeat protein
MNGALLRAASQDGDADRVRELLESGADVNGASKEGVTALMKACSAGHLECVRVLLAAGATIEGEPVGSGFTPGFTAWMAANLSGNLEIIRALLRAGANVNEVNGEGGTALMVASYLRRPEIARALLEAGADANVVDRVGRTAVCAGDQQLEMVKLLCSYGARRDDVGFRLPDDWLKGDDATPDVKAWVDETRAWTTQLHHLELLPAECVRTLLAAGADVHATNGSPGAPSPLSLARALLERKPEHESARLVLAAAEQ